MKLSKLKDALDEIIRRVKEDGNQAENISMSIQIDDTDGNSVFSSSELELMYDNDCQVSGCVLFGFQESSL